MSRKGRYLLFLFPLLILGLLVSAGDQDDKTSLFGTYHELAGTIECPLPKVSVKEFDHFGFKEYGYFKGGNWCKKKKAPPGYYVYVHPTWYVWRKIRKKKLPPLTIPSVKGRYEKLVKKIYCPRDRKFYKKFTEYGYHEPWVWCSTKTKPGHYVYVYPYWYVWKKLSQDIKAPPGVVNHRNHKYTYSELLQVIPCAKDEANYGKLYEYGPYDQGHVYCGLRSRKGYWVYSAPDWYVFKDRKKKVYGQDDEYENWPPK